MSCISYAAVCETQLPKTNTEYKNLTQNSTYMLQRLGPPPCACPSGPKPCLPGERPSSSCLDHTVPVIPTVADLRVTVITRYWHRRRAMHTPPGLLLRAASFFPLAAADGGGGGGVAMSPQVVVVFSGRLARGLESGGREKHRYRGNLWRRCTLDAKG